MWLFALISAALAAPAGHWHPDDLVPHSQRFAEANQAAGAAYEDAARRSAALAQALRDYREALDLLGSRAPAAEYERLDALERSFHRQHARAQAFADTLVEDFDAEFSAARSRAVAALGVEAVECKATIADGPQVPGMRPRTKPNPDCVGRDLNADLAAKIDADAQLAAALKEILAIPWPAVELPAEPVAPVGGGARHVQVRALLRAGAGEALVAIDREDDRARLPFEAAIEEGASADQLAARVAEAEAVTARTARARAELAEPVLVAADRALAKWAAKGQPSTGWCANPAILGGCTGSDASDPLVQRLVADKRVGKALP